MQLKKFKILLSICSLAFITTACGDGPTVTVGTSDPTVGGFRTIFKDGHKEIVPYANTENWIAYPAPSHQEALDYYKRQIEYWRSKCSGN